MHSESEQHLRVFKPKTLTFCYVEIKEITVQDCLNDACHDGDHVEEAFEVEAPDPVDEIQGTIEAEEEQVVSGDGLGFSGLADHEQLWEDGHGLQVDGERPHDLQWGDDDIING